MGDFVAHRHLPASETGGDWRERAACLDEDPELFFPVGETGPALLQIEDARAVCLRCPVIEQCLRWAIAENITDGVWGGQSQQQRDRLHRRAVRASRGYPNGARKYAIALFHEYRPRYETDTGALRAVAREYDTVPASAVRAWLMDDGYRFDDTTADARMPRSPETRTAALVRFREIRPDHRSDQAAMVVVTAEFGIHISTIREWVRSARMCTPVHTPVPRPQRRMR